MSDKSILVIDTPKNCVECKMSGLHGSWCHIIGDTYVNNGLDIADDCPLRPLPSKFSKVDNTPIDDYWQGYNAYRREITGESE